MGSERLETCPQTGGPPSGTSAGTVPAGMVEGGGFFLTGDEWGRVMIWGAQFSVC